MTIMNHPSNKNWLANYPFKDKFETELAAERRDAEICSTCDNHGGNCPVCQPDPESESPRG
jgi:hypothetical protein